MICFPIELDTDGAILRRQEGGASWGVSTDPVLDEFAVDLRANQQTKGASGCYVR